MAFSVSSSSSAQGGHSAMGMGIGKQMLRHCSSIACSPSWLRLGLGLGVAMNMDILVGVTRCCSSSSSSSSSRTWNRNAYVPLLACSMSLASASASAFADTPDADNAVVLEPSTGVSFPLRLRLPPNNNDNYTENEHDGRVLTLAGVGVRKKSLFGLANLNVYAFGIYADESSVKAKLQEKYKKTSASELRNNEEFVHDVICNDVSLTVRLEIVYGRLTIAAVRSAFQESLATRLKKLSGGTENNQLLARFTSQFRDDIKLPRGTKIYISRLPGQVLQTKLEDQELGNIESQLLCQSLFDLYIGEDPLDNQAKGKIGIGLTSLLTQQ